MRLKKLALALVTLFVSIGVNAQRTYTRYTNLPSMYVETFDGYGITSKTVEKYAKIVFVNEEDVVTIYDSVLVRGRGNSTWNMRKKPYRIKFNEKQKFLGQGYANAKKWTLMANAGDKTLIRNAVTSSMGKWLGLKFNPAYKFIDLNINGTYMGNYQVSDQVEVRKHRVNVEEQDFPLTEESDITGGYLLEVDGFKDGNHFTTSKYGVTIRIHYPDEDEIVAEQNDYIKNHIKTFETALSSNNYADPDKGYRAYVDSVSLANWFVATEVSANIDGYYSTYFYKEQQDQKLYWGPLWDYDVAYGNDTRKGDTSEQLMTDHGYGDTRNWMNRMWTDPWFAKLVYRRLAEALDGGLTDHMINTIDSLEVLLDESQQMNYKKWGIDTKMYNERVLWSSYRQYNTDLRNFIKKHNDYLRTAFAKKLPDEPEKPAEPAKPFEPGDYYYHITNSGNGKALDVERNGEEIGTNIVGWQNETGRLSQDWEIKLLSNKFYMLINRETGLALNDPTEASTATTNTGAQLNIAEPDSTDEHQLWELAPQSDNRFNLINLWSDHTANLSGGSSNNGTAILSYTTDDRNASSNNRLWRLVAGEKIERPVIEPEDTIGMPEDSITTPTDTIIAPVDTIIAPTDTIIAPTDTIGMPEDSIITPEDSIITPDDDPGFEDFIASTEPKEYALAYNEEAHRLHFGSETPRALTFMVRIFSLEGKLVGAFIASEGYDTSSLGRGTYIITWTCGGAKRSVKAMLNN